LSDKGGYAVATIMPEGEDIQKAIKWISMNLEEKSDQPLHKLVEKAVFKFDLSPVDTEFLIGFFKKMKATT
jgi:hypothetical protein